MNLSNKEAEEKAISLAEQFLASHNNLKWDWKCIAAKPDLIDVDNKERKTFTKWSVIVEWSQNGSIVDGPGVVLVNISSDECEFFG